MSESIQINIDSSFAEVVSRKVVRVRRLGVFWLGGQIRSAWNIELLVLSVIKHLVAGYRILLVECFGGLGAVSN